ncbi:MAG: Lrp/AsnC family transcriptional regulator [Asgard group archaeon]
MPLAKKLGISQKDRELLMLLEEDAELPQNKIAQKLGLSQPSIGVRIRKLKEKNIISNKVAINLKELGLNVAKVDATVNNPTQIIDVFKNCPYFLHGFVTSGKNNVCLFFASEDLTTLEALVDYHLRENPEVNNVELNIIIDAEIDLAFPIKMIIEKTENTPCGCNCKKCDRYELNWCLGCPYTSAYRGTFWQEK